MLRGRPQLDRRAVEKTLRKPAAKITFFSRLPSVLWLDTQSQSTEELSAVMSLDPCGWLHKQSLQAELASVDRDVPYQVVGSATWKIGVKDPQFTPTVHRMYGAKFPWP